MTLTAKLTSTLLRVLKTAKAEWHGKYWGNKERVHLHGSFASTAYVAGASISGLIGYLFGGDEETKDLTKELRTSREELQRIGLVALVSNLTAEIKGAGGSMERLKQEVGKLNASLLMSQSILAIKMSRLDKDVKEVWTAIHWMASYQCWCLTREIEKSQGGKQKDKAGACVSTPLSSYSLSSGANSTLVVDDLPRETSLFMLQFLFLQHPGCLEVKMVEGELGKALVVYQNEMQATIAMEALQGFRMGPDNPISITYAK